MNGRLDTLFWPALGLYDSSSQATIGTHIQEMLYGNITVGIASWWAKGSQGDQRMPALLQAAHGTPFKWAIYYDSEAFVDNTAATVRDNLQYIQKHYANDPSYLTISGKMVVFVYTSWNQDCSVVDKYRQANVGINAYLNFNIVPNWQSCTDQPDSWHVYNPTLREASTPHLVKGKWVTDGFTISPGFSPYYNSQVCTDSLANSTNCLPRNLPAWSNDITAMQQSGAKWQLITTFNEWNEGTSVEPSVTWASTSGQGSYLDDLAAAPVPSIGPSPLSNP
jgi:Glycosyl hydrolase family 99